MFHEHCYRVSLNISLRERSSGGALYFNEWPPKFFKFNYTKLIPESNSALPLRLAVAARFHIPSPYYIDVTVI